MAVLAPETLIEFPLGYQGITLLLDQGDTGLFLAGADNRRLLDFKPGEPDDQPLYAGTRDQDGDQLVGTRHGNRQVIAVVRMYGDTDEDLQDIVSTVDAKLDKLRREGGDLVVTVPSGEAYLLEVLAGGAKAEWGKRMVNHPRIDVTFEFTCGPYWLEAEEEVTLTTSMTSPCVIATAGPVRGSVPALGRLVVANGAAADQAFVMWGLQSRTYDPAATAGLFYEAEDLTPLAASEAYVNNAYALQASGGETIATGAVTAGVWAGVLSGEFTHTGDYRVWARMRIDEATGWIDVAMEWATGDFRSFTRNTSTRFDASSDPLWALVDLGLVRVPDDEEQWECRVIVRCEDNETEPVNVDYLLIMPTSEGYGEASGMERAPTATTFGARDQFTHAAGNLAGQTLDGSGGTWAGAGDSTDFTVATLYPSLDYAEREAASDTAPRVEYVSGLTLGGVAVGAEIAAGTTGAAGDVYTGVLARYVDTGNYIAARIEWDAAASPVVQVVQRVAGTTTVLASEDTGFGAACDRLDVVLSVFPTGTFSATFEGVSVGGQATLTGFSSDLASGGAIDEGSVGLYDYNTGATANIERTAANFYAYEIPSDPAVFSSQNLEVHHDRVVREHEASADLTRVSRYAGDYLLVPQEGSEGRDLRLIVKSSRADPAVAGAADSGLDSLGVSLFVTPRWLTLPRSAA